MKIRYLHTMVRVKDLEASLAFFKLLGLEESRQRADALVAEAKAALAPFASGEPQALKAAGYEVTEAEDGAVALGLARQGKYRVVLADVNMPNMDGITLVRNLRTLPDYKFTPLLMLTTESTPEKKAEGKAAGATGWLVKPFNPEQLIATSQKVLG